MDCIVAGLIVLLIGLIIGLKSKISAGFAGVALSNFISLSGLLTDIIMVWTEFETSMTSVERVKEFEEDTPLELLPSETITPPESWPDKGGINIQNITATYK
jgi:ATP-binding cassette, subfamily C (CFTR/MRP), member 1